MTSYSWKTGTSGGWGTIANWGTTSYPNSTTADATIAATGTYTVTIETGKSYSVDSVTLNDGSAALNVLGTLTLGGTEALLNIAAGTVELGGVVSGGTVSINSGATLLANGGTLKNLADLYMGGSGYINLNSKTLAIGGTSTLQGYIYNPGELILSGLATFTDDPYFEAGVTLDDTGTIDLTSNVQFGSNGTATTVFTIGSTGTVDITAVNSGWGNQGTLSMVNAGLFENTGATSYYNVYYNSFVNTGTLSAIAGSDISLFGGAAQLGGHISGAGELFLGGGTDSLETGLILTAATLGVNGNDTLILETGFSLSTQFDATYSSYVDLNGFNLTLSSANGGAIRGYVYGGGTLDISGSYAVGGLYLASGTEELVTGTAVQDGQNRLDYDGGTAASVLSIASTGTYDITAINNDIDYNNTIGNIINAGLFENIEQTPTYTANGDDDSYFNVYENFTNAATGTIYMGTADDISLLYGQDTLAGTITGPGDIYLGQHATVSLQAGLVMNNGRYLTISDGGTDVILESNRTFTSTYFELQNGANLNLNGYTLSLAAGETGQLGAYVSGPGTINAAGTFYVGGLYMNTGVTDVVAGVQIMDGTVYLDDDYQSTGTSEISITSTGTFDITTDSQLYNGYNNNNGTGVVINAGLFEKTGANQYTNIYADFTNASTGTIYIAADNDISLIEGTSSLAGTIEGPGYIYFGQGETATLDASLVIQGLNAFTASDGNTQVILEANETFAAPTVFTDQSSADILLNGNTLTLAGKSQFSGAYVSGSGTLDITGSADFNNFYAIGTMTVIDAGTITQDGSDELGINSSSNVTLSINSGAVYNIIDDIYINPQGTSAIDNAGLFEKTASEGISDIYAPMVNTGTIDAVTGTLRFDNGGTLAGTIIGAGAVDLNGGTFSLASSAVLSVTDFYLTSGEFILEKSQTFSSLFSENGGVLELNGFNVSLHNAGDDLANSYLQGPGTLTESARADVNNYYLIDGAVLDDVGTITQDGGLNLGNFGGDTATVTIATTGTYDILNDSNINTNGSPASDFIINAGLFEKTADNGNSIVYAAFNNTGTLNAAVGVISLDGGGTLAGTLNGAGELALGQYYSETYTLASSAVLSVATFALSGATLDLESTRSLSTVFIENGGTLNLDGFNLTLSNNADELVNAYVAGPGTLDITGDTYLQDYYVTGGAVLQDSGTITEDYSNLNLGQNGTDSGTLNISAGAVYNFISDNYIYVNGSGTINNAGLYEKTAANGISYTDAVFNNSGTIDAARGTLQLAAGGTLGGTLEGAGTIELNAGTFSLTSAAVVSVTSFDDYGATLDLLSNRTIAVTFNESGGAIALGGDTLTLSGNDYLNNYLSGPGTLDVTGTTDINGYNLTGGAVLVDAGTITMDNNVQIGENSTDTGTLSITSAGTFNILTDNYIYESGTVNVVNAGLFEKTGSGTGKSYVQGGFTNTGTIAVLTGDLEEQTLTNDGVVKISNAYDQTDSLLVANSGAKGTISLTGSATFNEQGGVGASQTIALTGANNRIDLVNGGTGFAGTINGFTASDVIDLQNLVVDGLSYAGGVLTLSENGTVETSIALAGITNPGSLGLVTDGAGGTDITFSSPGTITQPNGSIVTDLFTNSSGGDFNTAANWNNGIPGSLSNVVFYTNNSAETVTDSGNDTIYALNWSDNALTFQQSAGTLKVIAGGGFGGNMVQTGGDIVDETGTLSLLANGTIAGTLSGTGEIDVGGNSGNGYAPITIAAGAVLSVATLGFQDAILGGNNSFNGTFNALNGGYTDLNGYTLTLNGADSLAPTYAYSINGPGVLTIAGSAKTAAFGIAAGATLNVTGTFADDQYFNLGAGNSDTSALTIGTTGTYDLAADSNINGNGSVSVINAGLVEKTGDNGTSYIQYANVTQTSGGVINDTRGVLILSNDSGTLAGTLEGAFIDLNGDAFTIAAGAVLSVATLQIQGGNTITLGGGRTYAGNFDMSANGGGTLNLGSFGLDLTGPAELGGEYVGGSGIITVAASADMAGMQLVNSASLVDAGTITQDGGFALGYYGTDTTELLIKAGAVYDIINANNIGAAGTAGISNAGLFEKTGDFGISYIAPVFTNASTGTIDVTGGTIDLQSGGTLNGTIEGAGELYLQNNGGTFTLASTAVLTVGTLNVNEDLVLEHAETFTGDFIQTNNINLNNFALSLTGNAALDSSIEGPGTLTVTKGDINGLYLYQDAAMVVKGTVTQDGGFTMSNTGTDNTHLSIASGAVFDLLTDNSINANGTAAVTNAGLFEKTGDYGTSYIYPSFTNASTGTINLARGNLDFEGGGSFAGTIKGAVDGTVPQGAIIEGGGVLTLASAATLSVAELALQGGDLLLGGSRSYTGYFDGSGGSLSLNGDTFSVTAPYLGGFYLTGPGTLNVSGSAILNGLGQTIGSVLDDKGTIVMDGGYQLGYYSSDTSELTIASGATFDIITDNSIGESGTASVILNAGLFEKTADNGQSYVEPNFTNASTGIVDVTHGTLTFIYDNAVLDGTLEGAGEIILQSGGDTLTSSVVTVATLDVASYPTLGTNLTYGGYFILSYGDTLTLASHSLVLTGTAALIGAVESGTVTVSGNAYVQTMDLYGGSTLVDNGYINQIDELRFGENDGSSNTLSIGAHGTYNIQDDTNFHSYGNAGSAEVAINAGLLEKTGDTGLSELEVTLSNTGTVLLESGTLQVDAVSNLASGTLSGGTWVLDAGLFGPTLALQGGTLAVDAAKITLSGAGTELYAGGTLLEASLATVASGGVLALLGGRGFAAANTLTDAGTIVLAGGTLATPGLTVVSGGTLTGSGTVTGPITNSGKIIDTGAALTLAGSLSGTGSVLIDSGSTLILGAGAASGTSITFGGSLDVLVLDTPSSVHSTLVSLAPSDTIDLAGLTATAATISGSNLIVTLSGGSTETFALSGANTLDRAAIHGDGSGGTDIAIFAKATAGAIAPVTKNFGEAHTGAVLTQSYTIANTGAYGAYSENLDAKAGPHSTVVTDSGSFTGLAPGSTNSTALHATLVTTTGGLISGTANVSLFTDGSTVPGDGDGTLAIGTDTVTLTGTIFNYATAVLTPAVDNIGNQHVGGVLSNFLTISNGAAAGNYSENLDASFSGTSSDLTGTGTVSELAAGAANSTSLGLTLTSGTAGVATGTATLGLISDGSTIDTLGTTTLASQTVTVTGTLYNYATASAVAPNPIGFGDAHVGSTLSQYLTIANTAAAGGYSENLDASFSGTSSDLTGTGSVSELAAGSSNSTALDLVLASGAAGVQSGSATLGLVSDGSTIDGLGTTSLGSETVAVTGTLFNYATASATPTTIAFGQAHIGAALSQTLTLANVAASGIYSENLDASFSGTSTLVTTTGSVSELAAGSTNSSALGLTLVSTAAGVKSGTTTLGLTSDGSGIDTLGTTALTGQKVTVTGTLFGLATAALSSKVVSFGQHHVGDTLEGFITISNNGKTGGYYENLDGSFSGTTSLVTASGTLSELAAGSKNSTALELTLNSGTAGVKSGTATLALTSDGSGIDTLGTTGLANQVVTASGTLFNYATASTVAPINFGIVHVGQTVSKDIVLANKAAAGAFSENLDASFSGTTGDFLTNGSISELKAATTNSTSLQVTLETGTAGVQSGTTTLGLVSDGSTIDTLGTTVLNGETVTLTGTVNNYATATIETISGPGVLSGSGTTLTLNLGSVVKGAAALKENIGILNSAIGPADSLDGSLSLTGTTGFTNSGDQAFANKAAGAADTSPIITLTTGTIGTYTETIVVTTTGTNSSHYSGALTPETLIVTGTVTAAQVPAVSTPAASEVTAAAVPASPAAMRFAVPSTAAAAPAVTSPLTGSAATAQISALQPEAAAGKAGVSAWFSGTSGVGETASAPESANTAATAGFIAGYHLTGSDQRSGLPAGVDVAKAEHVA